VPPVACCSYTTRFTAPCRFGDDAHDTLFATVHDLDAVFDTHQALEQQKPEDKRGTPFVVSLAAVVLCLAPWATDCDAASQLGMPSASLRSFSGSFRQLWDICAACNARSTWALPQPCAFLEADCCALPLTCLENSSSTVNKQQIQGHTERPRRR
jgi:hypothetical protein